MSLDFDTLGKRAEAIEKAKAALEIYKELNDPTAVEVRGKLAEWQ
jgi:hypothetical protein